MTTAANTRGGNSSLNRRSCTGKAKGIIAALNTILEKHNWLEEANGGFYEFSERFNEQMLSELAEKIRSAPEVKSLPNNPDPKVLAATRRALERAGYDPDEYLQ